MAVSVACPACETSFPVSQELVGHKIRCKKCQAMFVAKSSGASKASVAVKSPVAPPAATSGNKNVIFAGSSAFVLMAGITAWALFGRSGEDRESTTDAPPPAIAKINLNDSVPKAETKAEPKVEANEKSAEKETEKPEFGPAKFATTPVNLPYAIRADKIERVKQSSAWIKVSHDSGGGFGSGWFAEPGIIITNSHVVGMKESAQAPPNSIKVTLFAGVLGKQREMEGELLGLDRDNDLAVIRIKGDNLPDPMPIARSSELAEGQRLYVIGFPLGNTIAKTFEDDKAQLVTTVKARQSSVAGRFPTKTGSIKLIQIEGGADPGNSGGMIVDAGGFVRCVLVAGIPGSNMRFAIPTEYVVHLLQGRMLKVIPAQPYESENKVRQPLTVLVADPMKRIKSVGLDIWAGEPGRRIRPASNTEPSAVAGESPRQQVAMTYNADSTVALGECREAKGECDLPKLKDGQVYWVQPRYVSTEGEVRWGEAVALEMGGLAVVRKPAKLILQYEKGIERKIRVESHMAFGIAPEGGELHLRDTGMKVDLSEKILAVKPDGSASAQIKYDSFSLTDEDSDSYIRQNMRGFLESARGMIAELTYTNRGAVKAPKLVMKNVPIPLRPGLERFNLQTVQSLEALSLALPGREVKPGETWKADVNYAVTQGTRLSENALFRLNYRYDGVRTRNGREEAVIEFEGEVVRGETLDSAAPSESSSSGSAGGSKAGGASKNKPLRVRGVHGRTRGAALVDLATGQVSLARAEANMEFEVAHAGSTLKFGAQQRVDLRRQVAPGVDVGNPDRLLPNQELFLNPFVGAPDVNLTQTAPRTSELGSSRAMSQR